MIPNPAESIGAVVASVKDAHRPVVAYELNVSGLRPERVKQHVARFREGLKDDRFHQVFMPTNGPTRIKLLRGGGSRPTFVFYLRTYGLHRSKIADRLADLIADTADCPGVRIYVPLPGWEDADTRAEALTA